MKSYLKGMGILLARSHWSDHRSARETRGDKMLPPRARGDIVRDEPTDVVTIVREPYSRMISLMRKTRSTLFDYTAHDDYHEVLARWGDIYSVSFVAPFTVVGKLGILKFELLNEAVPMMLEWLGIESDAEFPHVGKTHLNKPPVKRGNEKAIKAMYDGKYARHFGYEYSDNYIRT